MIFVTLGTHEQPFDRLVREVDRLIIDKIIKEDVFIQIGFSYKYIPRCGYEKILSFKKMSELIAKARIIITHGGPGSIILALSNGKVPIVVPRQKKFGEHVDDHQVLFTRRLDIEGKIIAVYDIGMLSEKIINYKRELEKLKIPMDVEGSVERKALVFSKKLEEVCKSLLIDKTSRL